MKSLLFSQVTTLWCCLALVGCLISATANLLNSSPFNKITLGGSLKSIASHQPIYLDLSQEKKFSLLNRLRLELSTERFQVVYDNQTFLGEYLRSVDFKSLVKRGPDTYLKWDWVVQDQEGLYWRHRLYRVWANFGFGGLSLKAGRQRIAWGTGRFWNPTDVLNPYQPFALERDERAGVDAVYAEYTLGSLNQIQLVYAPRETREETSFLGRWRGHIKDFDVSLTGGQVREEKAFVGGTLPAHPRLIAGGDFAVDVFEGGLRGEAAWFDSNKSPDFLRGVLSYDYILSSSWTSWHLDNLLVTAEYYYNEKGNTNPSKYIFMALLEGDEVSPARNYLGLSLGRDLHPLVRLEIHSIWNLDDGSRFVGPQIRWNVFSRLDGTLGFQHFAGSSLSEFGRLKDFPHFQLHLYF